MVEPVSSQQNVLGLPLEPCCMDPVTGFFRDGFCHTQKQDLGSHTVCVQVTDEFLQFSLSAGNDLITPHLKWGFHGLHSGDRWCLCAQRWKQAHEAGIAPHIYLRSTNTAALEVIPLDILKQYALDIS